MKNISFIIPAYNAEKNIEESILSIIDGNLTNGDEIVITNDGSTDNTRKLIQKLQKKHKEIKLINHKTNKGGGAARNTAVKNSKNELIFCLDSDNVLIKNSIDNLKKHLIKTNSEASSFKEVWYFKNKTNNISHSWVFDKKEYKLSDYLSRYEVPGASGNYLFTKKAFNNVGGYPEYAGALDSWGLGVRFAAFGKKQTVLPNSYYLHRIGHESYWVRSFRKPNTSRTALKILWPHFSKIRFLDKIYLLLRPFSWFSNISNKSMKVKGE